MARTTTVTPNEGTVTDTIGGSALLLELDEALLPLGQLLEVREGEETLGYWSKKLVHLLLTHF